MWLPIVAIPSSYYYIHENTNHHNHSTITFESRDTIIQYNGIFSVGLHHFLSTRNDNNEKDQIQRFLKTLQETLKSVDSDTSIQLEMIGSDLPQVLARQGKALNLNMKKWRQIVKARIENREKSEMNNINNNKDSEMIANVTDQGIDKTENDLTETIHQNVRNNNSSKLDLADIQYVKDTKPVVSNDGNITGVNQ